MNIRPGTEADLPAILQLIADVVPRMHAGGNFQWDSSYPNRSVFEQDIKNGQLWVAEVDAIVAGVAAITTDQEPEYASVGLDIQEMAMVVHRLAVSIARQGNGVAAALLRHAEKIARERGINTLRLDTNVFNQATVRLFPKLGYVKLGEISLSFRPGLRFYCYEKRLDR